MTLFKRRFVLAVVATLALPVCSLKRLHSHNDYLQKVPLIDALDNGIQSVEADIWWLGSGDLLVGHEQEDLDPSRSLDSLYLQPILAIANGSRASVTPICVDSPLQLLIEFKTDGEPTYQPLIDALQPLRAAGLLTTYANGILTQGAVTAVGTGNTPLSLVLSAEPRDFFYDANILTLSQDKPAENVDWSANIAPMASGDFIQIQNDTQLVQYVVAAHNFGIKTRYWDTDAEVSTWNKLWDAGLDWVNVDDLVGGSNAWAAYQASHPAEEISQNKPLQNLFTILGRIAQKLHFM